jgi:hypothetical protein
VHVEAAEKHIAARLTPTHGLPVLVTNHPLMFRKVDRLRKLFKKWVGSGLSAGIAVRLPNNDHHPFE